MRKQLILVISFLFCKAANSQRIVNNEFLKNIDEYFNFTDTLMSKNNYTSVDYYGCNGDVMEKDSCILFSQRLFDKNGRLIEFVLGDNLKDNKIDYMVRYKKVADTVFEAIVLYPVGSTQIDGNFFTDSIIRGKNQRVCLYKRDKAKNVIVRSVYKVDESGDILRIERYDIDNKLVHIYYPYGSRKPNKVVRDTVIDVGRKIITYNATYLENDYKVKSIFNEMGNLLYEEYSNFTFSNSYKTGSTKIIVYDSEGHPIISTIVDENNRLISEERYEYGIGGELVRHTKDSDISDGILDEEDTYKSGKIIQSNLWNRFIKKNSTWKFKYYENGLKSNDVYYVDGVIKSSRLYIYH